MKITILNGSPRHNGNTQIMADTFAKAAQENGHTATVLNIANLHIRGCMDCKYCYSHEGKCVQDDDMKKVFAELSDTDLLVFASPVYWFDITAQEKAAIDRLYAFGATGFPFTKTALLLDSHSEGVYDAAIAMYKSTCAYCKWEDQGVVTISGMTERDSMASSPKLEEVRELARKLA